MSIVWSTQCTVMHKSDFSIHILLLSNWPVTSTVIVFAVMPGIGDTFPVLALQVYSPASDSCTSLSERMDRVMFPSSLVVITLWSVRFCRAMPSLSQITSGGREPLASHASSNWEVNSSSDSVEFTDSLPMSVIAMTFGLTTEQGWIAWYNRYRQMQYYIMML